MSVKTYDLRKVVINFGGIIITGHGPEGGVKSSRKSDAFVLTIGADGSGVRSRLNDKSGEIEIELLQSSPVNDLLSAVAAQDELLGTGVRTYSLADLNGTSLELAPNAWIRKQPEAEWNKEAGTRKWVLDTDRLDRFVGGQVV